MVAIVSLTRRVPFHLVWIANRGSFTGDSPVMQGNALDKTFSWTSFFNKNWFWAHWSTWINKRRGRAGKRNGAIPGLFWTFSFFFTYNIVRPYTIQWATQNIIAVTVKKRTSWEDMAFLLSPLQVLVSTIVVIARAKTRLSRLVFGRTNWLVR